MLEVIPVYALSQPKAKRDVSKDKNKTTTVTPSSKQPKPNNPQPKPRIRQRKPVPIKLSLSSSYLSVSANEVTRIVDVNTNAKSWTIWGVPSWCTIENKTSRSFTLRVYKNYSNNKRSDYLEVRTPDGHRARIDIMQGANIPVGPSAEIKSITVDHNQSLSDGKGMIIHVKFDVHNMKGKTGRVAAYFYDNEGNALIDQNGRYNTYGTPSYVCVGDNFTPTYDNSIYSDFTLRIPYDELHQTGSSQRTLKFKISIWDNSVSPSNEFYNGNIWTSFYFTPGTTPSLTVDGTTTDKTKHFSESGGRETYYVRTSAGSYETWGVPSWCRIEDKTSSSFTLVCEPNYTSEERTDYMKVKAAEQEIRIDITQSANRPAATINNLWVDHNVFNGLIKGMKIHINLSVKGMRGKRVKYCVFFYKEDNTTKLINMFGNHISASMTTTSEYDDCNWSDCWIFVPYNTIFSAYNSNGRFSFNVEIQDKNGNLLGIRRNFQFYQTF